MAAAAYRARLPAEFQKQALTLALLTGWSSREIERRMYESGQPVRSEK